MLKVPTLTSYNQKYYKLKNESAKLGGRGASAPSTPLKPRPGSNKIIAFGSLQLRIHVENLLLQ
jgi:hypothetical protein